MGAHAEHGDRRVVWRCVQGRQQASAGGGGARDELTSHECGASPAMCEVCSDWWLEAGLLRKECVLVCGWLQVCSTGLSGLLYGPSLCAIGERFRSPWSESGEAHV